MNKYILSSGIGLGKTDLTSFDDALLHSGVANYNLVKVSSILPADSMEVKHIDLKEGSILYTAYSCRTSKLRGERIAAAIAVGIPNNPSNVGVIMELSMHASKDQVLYEISEMVKEAMRKRDYEIKEIKTSAVEAVCD